MLKNNFSTRKLLRFINPCLAELYCLFLIKIMFFEMCLLYNTAISKVPLVELVFNQISKILAFFLIPPVDLQPLTPKPHIKLEIH